MTLEELGVGDVFGELAVFAGEPRRATVEAVSDVSVMVLEERHFEQDLGMSFWLGLFTKALAQRYKEKDQRITELERELADKLDQPLNE